MSDDLKFQLRLTLSDQNGRGEIREIRRFLR